MHPFIANDLAHVENGQLSIYLKFTSFLSNRKDIQNLVWDNNWFMVVDSGFEVIG